MKKFICGILVGTILATAVGSFASGFWDNIDVLRNDISVIVNGSFVDSENFVYNDTTYLPLRAISNALNVPVQYDEETNTALIGESPIPTIAPTSKYTPPADIIDKREYIILKDNTYYLTLLGIEASIPENFVVDFDSNTNEFYITDYETNEEVYRQLPSIFINERNCITYDYFIDTIKPYIESL